MNISVKITMIIGTALISIATVLAVWAFVFRVAPKFDEASIELGTELTDSYSAYLFGAPFMHENTTVDISKVDMGRVGDYKVRAFRDGQEYSFVMHVVDTTAPEIVLPESTEPIKIELGVDYIPEDFVSGITDASGLVNTWLYLQEEEVSFYSTYEEEYTSVAFNIINSYTVLVVAADEQGNTSEAFVNIEVEDTLAPEIIELTNPPYYATGTEYAVDDFVESICDLSGFYSACFLVNDEPISKFSCDNIGDQDVYIYAVDETGNENTVKVVASFDEAPVFVAARDYHIKKNSKYDVTKNIIAVDNTDGNLTDKIIVSGDDFDRSTAGTYEVTYSVSDSHGLESVLVQTIYVGDEQDTNFKLQDDELQLLFDYDYFSYDLLEEADYDAALALVEPTLVNLKYSHGGGYTAGSGFIYSIEEDYIYIVTCYHVLKEMKGTIDIMFCDDNTSVVYIDPPEYEQFADDNEGAMFRIPTNLFSAETLLQLRQIYCDANVYSRLKKGDELISYSGHWCNQNPYITVTEYHGQDRYFLEDARHCVETSHKVKGGMSGTATFDEYGCLVGIVEGYSGNWDDSIGGYAYVDFHLMVDKIEDVYKRIKNS